MLKINNKRKPLNSLIEIIEKPLLNLSQVNKIINDYFLFLYKIFIGFI